MATIAPSEHEVEVPPGAAGLRDEPAERAGRHPRRGVEKVVVGHQSRTSPVPSGARVSSDLEADRPRARAGSSDGVGQHVEDPAGHGRGGRAAEAGLLQEHRDRVLRRGGRAEADEQAVGALFGLPSHLGGAGLAGHRTVGGSRRTCCGRCRPRCVVTPVRPSMSACRHSGGSSTVPSCLRLDGALQLAGDAVADLLDDVGLPQGAAVGEGGVGVRELERGDRARRPGRWPC